MSERQAHWSAARAALARLDAATARPWSGWASGAGVLIVGVFLLCLAALMVSVNVSQLRISFGWERHTDEVLLQIERLRESLLQAESSGRAYVLGGGPISLALRSRAYAEATRRESALRRLIADNPAQVARLNALEPLLARRLARFAIQPSEPALTGDPRAMASIGVRVQENERLMTAIRDGLDQVRNAELGLLTARQADADRRVRRSLGIAVLTAALALFCGVVGVHLLLRERNRHRYRELRTELMHTQRLALMGQTASTLAHELNQPLTAASNYIAAFRRIASGAGAELAPKLEDTAARATAQLQRAGGIVRRLRSFIDKRDSERVMEKPATLIDDAVMLLGTIDDTIALKTVVGPEAPLVLVDRIQIQQVLVNLLRNAIEAMRDQPRRELLLKALSKDGHALEITVQDSGPGLPKEIAARLFTPFVTSKKDGMGVGLSICRDIVLEHGGTITAEPAPGGGTLFRFTLPAIGDDDWTDAAA